MWTEIQYRRRHSGWNVGRPAVGSGLGWVGGGQPNPDPISIY